MLIGLIDTPVSVRPERIFRSRRNPVDVVDQLAGRGLAGLELDAGVQVLGVLAHDHQIDGPLAEESPHAGIILARPDAGEQAQLLPQVDVDAAEAGADRAW